MEFNALNKVNDNIESDNAGTPSNASACGGRAGGGKSHLAPHTRGRRIVISHYACAVSRLVPRGRVDKYSGSWAGAVVFAYFCSFPFYIFSVFLGMRERAVGPVPQAR